MRGIWLYGVTPPLPRMPATEGVAGEPVYPVESSGLTAIVGSVPLAEFAEEALRRKLDDMASLEAIVRAHHGVVDALARLSVVLPARLGTLYRDDEAVSAMLAQRAPALSTALRRVTGRAELGVKAYARPRDPGAAENAAGNAEGNPAGGEDTPGMAYLRRRRAQLTAAEEAQRKALADADCVHAALSRAAVAARRHRPQDPRLAGKRERMVLNGAYLVDRRDLTRFADTVGHLTGRYRDLELELTGPWPPYSFTVEEAG